VNHEVHRVHDHQDHHVQDHRLDHLDGHRQNHHRYHQIHQIHQVHRVHRDAIHHRRGDRRHWHRGAGRTRGDHQVRLDERQDDHWVVVESDDP
jgi:hypothetical protein